MNYHCTIRVIVSITLLIAFACCAYDTTDLTTDVVVVRGNAQIISQTETTYRGNTPIMVTVSRPHISGAMVVDYRIYLLGTNFFFVEGKNDAGLSAFALFHINTDSSKSGTKDEIEMFIRQPDGTVKPASTPDIESYRKECEAAIVGFSTMGPNRDVKALLVSPDRTFNAVLYESGSGVTDSYNRQIGIVTNLGAIQQSKYINSFFCITADGEAEKVLAKVEANWTSTNTLHIRFPFSLGPHGPHIVRTNQPSETVFVEYDGFEVR